jgi:hypothetical protein
MVTRRKGWGAEEPESEVRFSIGAVIRAITEIVPGGVIRAGKRSYGDGRTGFWLGVDADGLAKLDVGSSAFYVRWSGSELLIRGDISFTGHSSYLDYEAVKWVDSTGTVRAEVYSDVFESPLMPAHRLVARSRIIEGADSYADVIAEAPSGRDSQVKLLAESEEHAVNVTAMVGATGSEIALVLDSGGLDLEFDFATEQTVARLRAHTFNVNAGIVEFDMIGAGGPRRVLTANGDPGLVGVHFPAGAYCENTFYCDALSIGDGDAHLLAGDGSWSHGYDKVVGDVYGNVSALTLALRATTGTAPLVVASTTVVANFNADLLDGSHESALLLATGARAGATTQAQAFANGIIGPSWKPAVDSTTALQLQNAAGTNILNVDTENQRVGVGTSSPAVPLEVVSADAYNLGIMTTMYSGTDLRGAEFSGRRARGTSSSPTAVQNGDVTFQFRGGGYNGTNYRYSAGLRTMVDGPVSSTSLPQAMLIITGTTSNPTERMRVTSAGDVGIGKSNPASRLDIGTGALTFAEMTAPAAPAVNNGILFTRDDGAGVTQLCARFATGDILPLGVQGLTIPTYTSTNVTADRSFDANSTTLDEIADVLGTLIADLQARKFLN